MALQVSVEDLEASAPLRRLRKAANDSILHVTLVVVVGLARLCLARLVIGLTRLVVRHHKAVEACGVALFKGGTGAFIMFVRALVLGQCA